MAKILIQSDIDKTFLSASAKTKILNNYIEIIGTPCVYNLFCKNELILCLKEICKNSPKTEEQNEVISQCKFILNKLGVV